MVTECPNCHLVVAQELDSTRPLQFWQFFPKRQGSLPALTPRWPLFPWADCCKQQLQGQEHISMPYGDRNVQVSTILVQYRSSLQPRTWDLCPNGEI